MPLLKLLHTSDLQFDAPFAFLGDKGSVHRQRLRLTFKKIVDLAKSGQYALLLIAGDLFNDNRPTRSTVQFVADTLAGLSIPVCILPGNHDCLSKDSVYRKADFPANVYVLNQTPSLVDFADSDLMIAGNAVLSPLEQDSNLRGIARTGPRKWFVVLAHGNIQIPGKVEGGVRPITLAEIKATRADYVALGDWHQFADYSQGGVAAFYSGAPEPTAFSQSGAGHVASVTLSDAGVSVQPIKVGEIEAEVQTLDATGYAEQDVLSQMRARANANLMLELRLSGLSAVGTQIDTERIHAEIADCFYCLRIVDDTHVALGKIDPADFPEELVIGQYVKLLSEKIHAAGDARAQRIAERALQLGIALLRGEDVLK